MNNKRQDEFEKELEYLINKYSMENDSNTPDFMLAEYLMVCLSNFNVIMNKRDSWYKDSNKVVSKVTKFIKHSRNKVKKVFGLD